jgi:hypothetical protein
MTTTPLRQIRANFTGDSIVVYQAYNPAIADAALRAGRFCEPFSFNRMTWIKPSFLWLMARSGWATKPGQERILAVRVTRSGWERALELGVLTSYDAGVHADPEAWRRSFEAAQVHLQWDPERSLRGAKLNHRSIQVGISRELIRTYVDEWIVGIEDLTPTVRKIRDLLQRGHASEAARSLPPEKVYPMPKYQDAPGVVE